MPVVDEIGVGVDSTNTQEPVVHKNVHHPLRSLLTLGVMLIGLEMNHAAKGQPVHPNPPQAVQPSDSSSANREMENLCKLMAERLAYIKEVSKSKWNDRSPIEDPIREQKILQEVQTKAVERGVPAQWALHFFRLQIEASKQVEYRLFAQWRAAKQGQFSDTLNLNSQIRPHLDNLTDLLMSALQANWPAISSPSAPQTLVGCAVSTDYRRAFDLALMPLNDHSASVVDLQAAPNPASQ